MIFLLIFAFLAGIVTVLSPCILPVLPIVLSGTVGEGKRKPLGIVLGFILSFTFFTLTLSTIVKLTGISADTLRYISVFIILIFGFGLLVPKVQLFLETYFSKVANLTPQNQNPHPGFFSGILIGLSLGLVWTPCVGPIIASVITLAATSSVNLAAVFITVAYSIGTAIPMFIIMISGRALFNKVPWLLPNTGKIQKVFGVLMILTALAIFFNFDRTFQSFVLNTFPQYGTGLTKLEDNKLVKDQLEKVRDNNFSSNSKAPEIIEGGKWFNSDPLKISELRGKVVLVDFWTYTCINCIRTLPYLKSWHEKYSDKGLVIIGVHTPEFEFEKNPANLQKAIDDFQLKYPIIQDNDYATWQAYSNQYWPAKYLIDAKGEIRYTHFGEGDYDETEKIIQELLRESGNQITEVIKNEESRSNSKISPETYLGSKRMLYLHPEGKAKIGTQSFTLKNNIPADRFSFSGEWKVATEYSESGKDASLEYNFNGKKVFLVMTSTDTNGGKVKVSLDGNLVTEENQGTDVQNGFMPVNANRLYELVNLDVSGNHLLHLEFTPGIQIFAFTFE